LLRLSRLPAVIVRVMFHRRRLLAAVAAAALHAEHLPGRVVAITDGDTIKVMHDGAAERIRMWDRASIVTVTVRDIESLRAHGGRGRLARWSESEPGTGARRAGVVVSAGHGRDAVLGCWNRGRGRRSAGYGATRRRLPPCKWGKAGAAPVY